jgi:hypothetical protein
MTMYVVKKHEGQWSVSASDGGLVTFDSYSEAVETARLAAAVIAEKIVKASKRANGKTEGAQRRA